MHGFGGSRDDFAEWLPGFEALGWSAESVQLPGHGSTAPPYSLAGFGAFVLAEADRLGWDRFVLFGHSMGGMVAQLLALSSAERLDALVLMGTTHGPIPVDAGMLQAAKGIVQSGGMAALVEAGRGHGDTPAHERVLAERNGYREFMEAKALAMDPEMWVAMVDEMLAQPDRLDALRSVPLATLVVVGEQDGFREDCERIASAMPNARLAVIPDAGHAPQFEAPEAWWRVLSSFLEEVG